MNLTVLIWNLQLFAMTFIGFLISSTMVVIISPILIVFWVVAKIVYFIIKLKLGDTFIRPGGLDIIQGFESEKSRPYINAIGRYEGKVDLNKYAEKFYKLITEVKDEEGNARFKKFTQVFEKVCGYHVFRDAKDFDMRNHVRIVPLISLFPEKFSEEERRKFEQSNLATSSEGSNKDKKPFPVDSGKLPHVEWEQIINRLLSRYGFTPLPPGIPQWEILVVEEDDHYTMVFKVHHSFSDGVYILRYYLEYMGDHSVPCNLPYNYHQPNITRKFLDCFWAFCLLPFGLSRLSFPYENNPFHGPQLSGDKMLMISKPIPLELLKQIKRESKTSMNTVFFTCLSNSIAMHFKKKKSNVPYIVALVPVSLHDLSRPIKLRNLFGLSGVALPTFLDKNNPLSEKREPPTALARLNEVQSWLNKTKDDPSFLAIHWLMVFICSLLPSALLKNAFSTKGLTTSLSNLAGPPKTESFHMIGCKKTDFAFFIPDRNPLGMGISVAGFGDKVRIGLMIDRVLMETEEEGQEFLDAFRDEVTNLLNELRDKQMAEESINCEFSTLMIRDIP